jgi:hypothetical protein
VSRPDTDDASSTPTTVITSHSRLTVNRCRITHLLKTSTNSSYAPIG